MSTYPKIPLIALLAVVAQLLGSGCRRYTPGVDAPLVGKWKCEGQVVTVDDGSRQTIPYTGEASAAAFDLELFADGRYLDVKEGIQGNFAVVDANHIQFKIMEATRLPKGLSYTNEFSVSRNKLTLSVTKNPPGIRRIDIVYAKTSDHR